MVLDVSIDGVSGRTWTILARRSFKPHHLRRPTRASSSSRSLYLVFQSVVTKHAMAEVFGVASGALQVAEAGIKLAKTLYEYLDAVRLPTRLYC